MKSLEELQRRQSAVLELELPSALKELPRREMPDSKSKDEAEMKDEEAMKRKDAGDKPTFKKMEFATPATSTAAAEEESGPADPVEKTEDTSTVEESA